MIVPATPVEHQYDPIGAVICLNSNTRRVLNKVDEGFAGVPECSRMFWNGGGCSRMFSNVLERGRMFLNVLECSGSFLGFGGGGGVRRIPTISLVKIILGVKMRRTPSKVAGFSPLVFPARGVTSRPRVDCRRRLARGIRFYEKKLKKKKIRRSY